MTTSELLRFNGSYDDVFVEDDGYLYVESRPFDFAHQLVCRVWKYLGDGNWLPCEHVGAVIPYLETLKHAPEDVAKQIITLEWVEEATLQDEYLSEDDRLNLDPDEIWWSGFDICI